MEEFKFSFQLSKLDILRVSYDNLNGNKAKYFSISAAVLQRGKRNYERCIQCQEEVYGAARRFVNKFNSLHNKCLNKMQYNEIVAEIEILKQKYNWIESDSFNEIVSMSKLTPKKI